MTFIQPINESIQERVIIEVQRYIDVASSLYKKKFGPVDVVFNLKGRAAGIYRCYYEKNSYEKNKNSFYRYSLKSWFPNKQQQIRFNPWLFAKYPDDSWGNTIPHEVAHYISDCLYGLNKIKPHGVEWRNIMECFGAEPIVRGEYSLDGIPVRKMRRYNYRCACREVALSSIRHRKVQGGQQEYRCRDCSEPLVLIGA